MTLPSLFLAIIPQPAGHSLQVEAYQAARPVRLSREVCTREKRFFSGLEVQPAATERLPIPAVLRKVRRFIPVKAPLHIRHAKATCLEDGDVPVSP